MEPQLFKILGNKTERYNFIQKALIKFRYMTRSKKDKGTIIRYLIKMTEYSRQQITRLIKQYTQTGQIRWTHRLNNGFDKKYQNKDIQLLAQMDERHDTPCGHAVKKLCDRAYHVFGDQDYACLSELSVSHLYNLRATNRYKRQRRTFTKTKSRKVAIGERRKPNPEDRLGYIRIDTVHQGDLVKNKGVYHINAIDEVTQFEIVCSVEKLASNICCRS